MNIWHADADPHAIRSEIRVTILWVFCRCQTRTITSVRTLFLSDGAASDF